VLDEIHKYAEWRGLVKGLYDKNKAVVSVIVTGSARLDHAEISDNDKRLILRDNAVRLLR